MQSDTAASPRPNPTPESSPSARRTSRLTAATVILDGKPRAVLLDAAGNVVRVEPDVAKRGSLPPCADFPETDDEDSNSCPGDDF